MLTIGGTPSVYAGDEWAYRGVKEERFGGDDAVRPEFPSRPAESEHLGHDAFRLHQHLIGLRRRHPWLHGARTSALHLANRQYVYRTSSDAGSLVVALNVDDSPLRKSLSEFGIDSGRVVAGSGAPPEDVVDQLEVEPHGWAVLTV
jgi:glycosidase